MKPFATCAAPIAAIMLGGLALAACSNDDNKLADNSYSVPSERDGPNESLSGYPTATPATPAPGTLGNPDTSPRTIPPPILPPNPDDPGAPPNPASPPVPLP